MLAIKDLCVSVEGKEVVKSVNLNIGNNQIHALIGPNGGGKTSLAFAIMGHPNYKIIRGSILFNNEDITKLAPWERAKKGLFLAFQNPVAVEGLKYWKFLREGVKALCSNSMSITEFLDWLKNQAKELNLSKEFIQRELNVGFSGGEKKRSEMLQLLALNPKLAILDEIDSGLDIDGLKTMVQIINKIKKDYDTSFIVITHYPKFLELLKPEKVHIMLDGKILASNGLKLVKDIERKGYNGLLKDVIKTKNSR